ncbi:MAG: hypothetical protein JKY55_09805 [Aliivibrio sp.]|uniref:hypothetical protein n=1 Tax=Aliivibrio sp. TaxID=1872443 RepID=UPI001A61FD3D|nr:hypothetical protein [Aliivibrio sp.]
MAKNVKRWYGVGSDETLFSGNHKEISAFRNACHRAVETDDIINHKYHFPKKKGNGKVFGGCYKIDKFKAETGRHYNFKKDGNNVFLCRNKGAEILVHPTEQS